MPNIIKVENLTKKYGAMTAVNGVSFAVCLFVISNINI